MAIKSPINTLCKAFLCMGCFFSVSINAQLFNSPVLIEGGEDISALTGLAFGSSIYIHTYNYNNNASHNYFYKINQTSIDSILVRDFNDSITYAFRHSFEKNGDLFWIGTYDFPDVSQYSPKGIAVVKTDTNCQIIDRVIIPKNDANIITSGLHASNEELFLSYFTTPASLNFVHLHIDDSLSLIIDTSYTSTTILPNSLVKIDDKIVFFHRQSRIVETIELPDYNLLPTDTVFSFSPPFTSLLFQRAYRYNDSLILTSNYFAHGFMLLDNYLNIVDTMTIPGLSSTNYDTYYDFGSSVLKGNTFFYGCTTPAMSVLNPHMQGDIVVVKIKDLAYQWDCLISDDSTSKTLTNMFFSNDSNHIYLQYVEYDHRKGNFEFDVVITMMDTMCNVLSTHKIAKQKVDVLVYPNPTSEAFTFKGSDNDTYALSLYNLSGKAVLIKKQVATDTSIYVDHLPAGMYMLHVQSERNPEQVSVIKMVIR